MRRMKVIACDVDGTMATKGTNLMPKTRQALIDLHNEGVLIGIATGRPLDDRIINKGVELYKLPFEWDFCIGLNGCELWDKEDNEVERFDHLQPETIREILDFIPLDIANPLVYRSAYSKVLTLKMDRYKEESRKRNNSYFVVCDKDEMARIPTGKIEFNYDDTKDEELLFEIVKNHPSDKYKAVKTFKDCLEFVDPKVDKANGFYRYLKKKGIAVEDSYGIGDMDNDFELIRDSGTGICMINGCQKCKDVADYITDYPVEKDGFGRFFYDHYFEK